MVVYDFGIDKRLSTKSNLKFLVCSSTKGSKQYARSFDVLLIFALFACKFADVLFIAINGFYGKMIVTI